MDKKSILKSSSLRYLKGFAGTITATLSRIINIINGLIAAPLLISYVGPEKFGLWITITSLLGFLIISDLGLGSGLVNRISSKVTSDDREDIKKSITSIFLVLILVSTFLIIIFLNGIYLFDWNQILGVKEAIPKEEITKLLLVLSLIFCINIPINLISQIQLSFQESYKTEIYRIFGYLSAISFLIVAINNSLPLHIVLLGFTGIPIAASFFNLIIFFSFDKPWTSPSLKSFDLKILMNLLKVGSVFLALTIANLIGSSLDNLIVARNIGLQEVATYGITKQMFSLLYFIVFIASPFWPAFSEALETREYIWIKTALLRLTAATTLITTFICIFFIIFGEKIIMIWIGRENILPSQNLLIAFSFFWIVSALIQPSIYIMQTDNYKLKLLKFTLIYSLISLLLKVLFIDELGIVGLVWIGTLTYLLLFCLPIINFLRVKLASQLK